MKLPPTGTLAKPVNDLLTFALRIVFLYVIWMLCRVGFYFANAQLIGPIAWSEVPGLLKGSLIYDSGSIFYINLPFLLFSLLPLRLRARAWYQSALMWLFVVVNSIGIAVNLADIFYYPFKLARIASDDLHFLTNGNFGTLLWGFLGEFWYGFLAWIGIGALLWFGFRKIGYRPTEIKNPWVYYTSQTAILGLMAIFAIIMIRGGNISKATYPINISDAGLYAAPTKTGLIVSNPFALIRTMGSKEGIHVPQYYSDTQLDSIFSPEHYPAGGSSMRQEGEPNVMLIILESFASSHIRELSDQFPADAPSFTPFLDSLIREGYIFRNAYHNGMRSIDALPSLWASIPTFKRQFLSMPQSMAPFHALPQCMKEMGYSTAFLHGAVRQSMSFVAFGRTVGVENFFSQEDYEQEHGRDDFDGKWGIWDHKFFPFIADKVAELPRPFFATMFSLSSHHPFQYPPGGEFDGRYPEGKLPIQRMFGYSDEALRHMFERMSANEWFRNTIFIITADHGSGSDNEKYLQVPYNYAVPLLFWSPGGLIPQGSDHRAAGHIDLMPTLLGMLGYDRPYFAFGQDLFATPPPPGRAINYMGGFNAISDDRLYLFNETDFTGIYDYRRDPLHRNDLRSGDTAEDDMMRWTKAFIQQYYKRVSERNFTVDGQRD